MTCLCGARMVPATRVHRYRQPIDVLICWECGNETPPLYRRTASIRNGDAHRRETFPCAVGAIERRTA